MATKKDVKALEQSIARARAEQTERVLKKLNQGATFREIEQLYGMTYADARKFVSTARVHMTVEELNFFRETAEHFGMLPNEAIVYFAKEAAKKAHSTLPGAPDSPLTSIRRAEVVQHVYDKMVGNRGDLHLYPRLVKTAKKKKPAAKKAGGKKKAAKKK
jgi:hypothetical protein